MNRIYRLVFNRALGQLQVASELASGVPGAPCRVAAPCLRLGVLACALLLATSAQAASSLPTGFSVGSGTVATPVTSGTTMTVTQTGNKALINWSDFSIGEGYSVKFVQDSTSALTLNVVTSSLTSQINGSLTADGGVFLINPNGIVFGSGASVKVGNLVASTLALSEDSDPFYTLAGSGTQAVVNYGAIETSSGGSVVVVAPAVVNSGYITADSIALLAASKVSLVYMPGVGITASLQGSVSDPVAAEYAVNTTGTLKADTITLRTMLSNGLFDTAINMGGTIEARSLEASASGGSLLASGDITATNFHAASAAGFGQSAGTLTVGTLDLAVTGTATLESAGNAISALQGAVGGGLSLVNAKALTQASGLGVGGTTTIDNSGYDITLTNANNGFGGVVTLAGNNVALASGGDLRMGDVQASGNIRLSGGTLTLANPLDAGANALSLTATSGALNTSYTLSGGAVSLYGATGIGLGADVVAESLTLGSGNAAITQSAGALDVEGSTKVDAGTGQIVLDRSTNTFGGTVDLTGGSMSIAADGTLALGKVSGSTLEASAATIALGDGVATAITTTGAQTYAGAVAVAGSAELTSSGGGAIAFNSGIGGADGALTVSTGGSVSIDGDVDGVGDLSISAGNGVQAHAIDLDGDLRLITSGAAITQNGAYTIGGTATFNAQGGDITLNNTGNAFNGAVAVSGGDVDLYSGTALTFGDSSVTGTLSARSAAGITQASGTHLEVDGTSAFTAAGDVALGNAANRFGGSVDVAGNAVTLAAQDLLVGALQANGDVALSGGTLSLSQDIDVGTHALSLSATASALSIDQAVKGGAVDLGGRDGVTLAQDVLARATLDIGSDDGAINQTAGTLTADGTTTLAAAGDITLGSIGNDFGGTVHADGAAITLVDADALALGTVRGSSLDATAAGALTLGDTLLSNGAELHAGGALDLGSGTIGAALLADSAGDITQSGSLTVVGSTTLTAAGDITLTDTGNDFVGDVEVSGNAVHLFDANDLRVASLVSGTDADVSLVAGETLSLPAQSIDTGSGALTLASLGGSLVTAGALSGGTVSLTGRDGITLAHAVAAGGTLGLTSRAGAIAQTGGALDVGGVSTIVAAGDVALTSAGNVFGGVVDASGAALALSARDVLTLGQIDASSLTASAGTIALGDAISTVGGQTYDGAVSIDGDVALASSGGADLTFTSGIGGTGALALATDGAVAIGGDIDLDSSLDVDAGSFDAQAIRLSGDLALTTASAIVQNGAYDIGGTSTFDANGNAITLTNSGNRFGEGVSLDGGVVAIRAGDALTLSSVTADSLDAGSSGTLTTGALDVGGNALLDGAGVTLGAGTVGGALAVTSSAGIAQSGALAVDGSSSFDAAGDIALDDAGNRFGQAVTLSGADVTVASGSALGVAGVSASGDVDLAALTLTSSGAISGQAVELSGSNGIVLGGDLSAQSLALGSSNATISQSAGSIRVGGTTTVDADSGAITLTQGGNTFGGAVALDGGALVIAADGTLTLGSVTGSSLSASADTIALGGDIRTTGSQRYVGDVSVDSSLALAGSALSFSDGIAGSGSLDLQAGGTVAVGGDIVLDGSLDVEAGRFDAHAIRLGGDLALSTADAITQDGAYVVGGISTFDANGNAIILTDSGNRFGGAVSLAGGATTIRSTSALTLASADADSLDAGSSGVLTANGLAIAGDTTLQGAGVRLGTGSIGGALAVTSSAGITQSGAVSVAGASRFDATGAIALGDAGNRFGGAVSLDGAAATITATGALTLGSVAADSLMATATGALDIDSATVAGDATLAGAGITLGSVAVGGDLQASSSGAIGQRAALTVAGTSTLAATGAVVLEQAGNDFQGAVSVAGSQVSLVDANDLTVASVSTAGSGSASTLRTAASASGGGVSLVAGGRLQLDGAIDAGSGDLVLASNGGSLTTSAALSGGTVSLTGRDGLTLGGDVDASGTLTLSSAGTIVQTGGVLTAATLTGSAGGRATLDGDNRIGALGDFSATALSLGNAHSLTVTGSVDAGSDLLLDVRSGDLAIDGTLSADAVRLQSAGAISETADGRIVAGTLSGSAGGATMLGDAGTFAANQVQTLGDFQSHGGFSMTNARTLTLASLNGSRFSVDAGTAAFFLKVDGGDLLQQGTTPVYAGSGTWWSSGHIGTAAAPIYVVTSSIEQIVDYIGLPPAYFYALSPDGAPVFVGGAVNLPASALATRAQSGSLQRVAYVDMGALNAEYRPFGIVQPGIRLPADQQPACDAGDPDAGCAQ